MSETPKNTKISFLIVGIIFLLWNLFGCLMYVLNKMTPVEKVAETQGPVMAAALEAYPAWATGANAIAVWVGLIAAICLLMRKKIAFPLFILSLIAAIICFIPTFTEPLFAEATGGTHWVMPMIVVFLGLVEIWWTRRKISDGLIS